MAKSCFTDMLNLIQPPKFLVARNGFLLMVDCPECCRHLTGLNLFVISIGVVLSNCFVFFLSGNLLTICVGPQMQLIPL